MHPECESALAGWLRVIEDNEFQSFAALKAAFNSVDKVEQLYVFDIEGNKLRFSKACNYLMSLLRHR